MTQRLSLDFETRSVADLKAVGAYKYAEHPSTQVVVLAVREGRLGDGKKVLSWDGRVRRNEAVELLHQAIVDKWEIHAFNSQFEWAILKHVCTRQLRLPLADINRLRCTSALCRSAGLPPSLDRCADFLKLPIQKDKMGRALIQKFSVPRKDGTFIEPTDEISFTVGGKKTTAAEAFQWFVNYCENDVLTEMAVADAMAPFELKGFPLDWFLADARMNDRGVPVDVRALEHARALYLEHEANLTERFTELTGLTTNQNKKVLEWMRARGYEATSLDKKSREAYGNNDSLSDEAKEAMRIKAELSFAAVKKIPAMSNMAMSDGFIRGAFKWCGAQKTWRWTSENVQFTNMKKPSKKLRPCIEEAFQDISNKVDLETFAINYGDPYEVIASLARYFVRFPDKNIFDLDYSSVEAKILPKLIDCNRILDRFDSGEDIYTTTAAALTKTLKEKFEDFPHIIDRDEGKTIVLATQFGGGWNAVFTATGQKWKREWCEVAVSVVRKENPEFPEAWRQFQDAFVEAMDSPGTWIQASPYVKLGFTNAKPFPRMLLRLPSGRKIVLPLPNKKPITMVKVVTRTPTDDPKKVKKTSRWERVAGHTRDLDFLSRKLDLGHAFLAPNTVAESCFTTWEISYYGHVEGVHYGRVHTYGGDLLQSSTQGTGADLLALGILEAERRDFEPFLCVHDQCLSAADGDKDNFTDALCVVPKWFPGFPLSAETDVVRSYCKN